MAGENFSDLWVGGWVVVGHLGWPVPLHPPPASPSHDRQPLARDPLSGVWMAAAPGRTGGVVGGPWAGQSQSR